MEYEVSPDVREKEKIVGGLFTATQTVALGIGAICGGGLAMLAYNATSNIIVALFVLILGLIPFVPFAFIKIEKMGDMELFFYLVILLKYKFGQKIFLNMNENQRNRLWEEINNESNS